MGKRSNKSIPNTKLKEARIRKIMTQQELADAVGITRKEIDLIENGRVDPRMENCIRICKCLGCSLSELFDDE